MFRVVDVFLFYIKFIIIKIGCKVIKNIKVNLLEFIEWGI